MVMMGERNSSAEAIKKLEGRITSLEHLSNKMWSMAFTAEKEGRAEAAAKYTEKMNRADDLQEGILEALGTLGFSWEWKDHGLEIEIYR